MNIIRQAMLKINKKNTKNLLYHILLWIVFFGVIAYGFTINLDATMVSAKGDLQSTSFSLLPFRLELYGIIFKVIFFYCTIHIIFPKFLQRKKIIFFIPILLGMIVAIFLLETMVLKWIVIGRLFDQTLFTTKAYTYYLYRVNPLMYFILTTLAFVYFFVTEKAKDEKIKNIIKQEQLKTELTLLRYQINPHFLFNTLNNFYSIAQEHNVPELENGILKLSNMMRYILYESNHEKMPLKKEIEYIQNYINIYQYKFNADDQLDLQVTISGDPEKKFIAPLLFIPLIENGLKHGVRYNRPSMVQITITIDANHVAITVLNTLHSNKHSIKDNYGIGLANIKKRIDLIYADEATFHTAETEEHFRAFLKVPIHAY